MNTTMNTGAAIEPCPFCGSTNIETTVDEMQGTKWGFAACGCSACGPEVRTAYNTRADAPWRQDAIAAWNDRATTPQADAAPSEDDAWESYLAEQKLIIGMPGLHARPSFIAGYRAAIAAGGAQEAIYQVIVGEKWVDSTAAEYAAVSNEKRIVYAAPLPREAATVWQPIETAPKTGRTLLLGYLNSAGKWRTVRGQWMSEVYISEQWEEPDDAEPGWYETSVEADDAPNCWSTTPTHWMPLPAAPAESNGAPK
jgi:Lar family restriction alleviation protein